MIDPYFPSEPPSGRPAGAPPTLRGADFGPDYVFCTHDHLDHTHPEYLVALAQSQPHTHIIATDAGARTLAEAGVEADRTRVVREGDVVALGDVRVKVLRTKTKAVEDTPHFSYAFQFEGGKVWHSGDMMRGITSVPELVEPIVAERPHVALLTMRPTEGAEFPSFAEGAILARRIGAKVAIPAHHGHYGQYDYDMDEFVRQFGPGDAVKPVIIEYCGCYVYRR
jgi:L-ascorbate metabolism protein UlaG (beta-lactamase superfamily)